MEITSPHGIRVGSTEAKEKDRGNFRDTRWDFQAHNFVDVVTGETYGEADVMGWTVGAFPF